MNDDERAHALEAIAGVSMSAPKMSYAVEGLSFGGARLDRMPDRGQFWSTVELSLSAAAAKRCGAQGGSDAATVTMSAHAVSAAGIVRDLASSDEAKGLRALLCDHRLLARPPLLRAGRADDLAGGSPAGRTLSSLSKSLHEATHKTDDRWDTLECDACRAHREVAEKTAQEAEIAALERAVASAKSKTEAARLQRELAVKRLPRRNSYAYGAAPRRGDCPHAPMLYEALAALCKGAPELAFEAAGLLRPAFALDPPRFVVEPQLLKATLGHWLVGRARGRYDTWFGGYDDGRRSRHRAYASTRDRERQAAALPPEQRAAVAFAATAWETDVAVGLLGWRPDGEQDGPPVTMETDVAADERLDVAVVLPEGVAPRRREVAPKREAPPRSEAPTKIKAPSKADAPSKKGDAPPPARTSKSAAMKPPPATQETPATSDAPPVGEVMTADLRAKGFGPTDVKRMLAEGVLERTGFGWYRFVRAPG